jgi:hypothetical protein
MTDYRVPEITPPQRPGPRTAVLVASGDFRRTANVACWPAQKELEDGLRAAVGAEGWSLARAHPERRSDDESHGFIHSQAYGREVFAGIHPEAPLIVAEAVWQYSQHVLIGLQRHRGPVLIAANWSGKWPGLVGALNLRGSLAKAGVAHSIVWAENFGDAGPRAKLREWLQTGRIEHDVSHVAPLDARSLPDRERRLGEALAAERRQRPAILGVFDEGCMGMFNAIVPDHLLHAAGAFKERLSQSALYAAMQRVGQDDARAALDWLRGEGMRFEFGADPAVDLTEAQVIEQLQMYIAAARLADLHECDAIGIQYQLGLMDTCAASDLAEGLLNCSQRPRVVAVEGPRKGQVIRDGRPITHFNEVDECAGLDGLITDRVWSAMGLAPDNTLHDLRWGDADRSGTTDEYVWVFEISGAVPPSHFAEGYRGAVGKRQPMPFFLKGGSSISGVSKPGEVVWSRIFVEDDALRMDIGRCRAIALPEAETRRRLEGTTPQWPIMHAVLQGVSRDQMMARHRSNHIQVAYAPNAETADRTLAAKAAMASAMGLNVNLCEAH